MMKEFPGHYRPDDRQFSDLWKQCVFVPDTSVLLNLYRYSMEVRQDLFKVFNKISDRLWVPHQAALEFQENRLSVIAEQVRKFDEVRKVLTEAQNGLQAELGKLQLKKRHSSINPERLLSEIGDKITAFLTNLNALEKQQPDVFDHDEVREQLDKLLKNKIGSPPPSQDYLNNLYEDGKVRREQKRPPGYLDRDKGKDTERSSYVNGNLVFKKEFGDLILWRQVIEFAKESKLNNVIFVTDDEKEDWWWIVESRGGKTIGPRPELVEELAREAGVENFYMYTSERFLENAIKYLGVQIRQQSIEQVRDVAQLRSQYGIQYLVVRFPRSRRVLVDDEFNGRTDDLIEIEAGRHVVSLAPPYNYTPEEQTIILKDTAELEPREVSFDLLSDA